MDRRSFLTTLLKATAGAMILPSAVTYARTWQSTVSGVLVPSRLGFWFQTSKSSFLYTDEYLKALSEAAVFMHAKAAENWSQFSKIPLA